MVEIVWHGDKPYFLAIDTDTKLVIVDLDEPDWAKTYDDLMRAQGTWYLTRKSDRAVVFSLRVWPGEQPFVIGRHVGIAGQGGALELTAYGVGKKRPNGSVVEAWILPNGQVVLGDDVEWFGVRLLREQATPDDILNVTGQVPAGEPIGKGDIVSDTR